MPIAIVADYEDDIVRPTPALQAQREQDGRCGECGLQTHEMKVQDGLLLKTPLTIEHEVHRGRCLFCHPIMAHQPQHFPSSESQRSTATTHSSNGPTRRRVSSTGPDDVVRAQTLSVLQGAYDIVHILGAMSRLPHDASVQELGCERLWILSWEEDNAAAIGRVGGIPILLQAMATFPDQARIQQCSLESLQNLSLNEANGREICESAGIERIVAAMQRHPWPGIQQCGCNALASLATSKFHQWMIQQAGGVDVILQATLADEESVVEAANAALAALGMHPNGRITPPAVAQSSTERPMEVEIDG